MEAHNVAYFMKALGFGMDNIEGIVLPRFLKGLQYNGRCHRAEVMNSRSIQHLRASWCSNSESKKEECTVYHPHKSQSLVLHLSFSRAGMKEKKLLPIKTDGKLSQQLFGGVFGRKATQDALKIQLALFRRSR